jgi:uncharacterized membrane protein YwzB
MEKNILMILYHCTQNNFLIEYNVLWLCVCYFGLQTLAFKDKFYSQNNSTKPLLVAGAVN